MFDRIQDKKHLIAAYRGGLNNPIDFFIKFFEFDHNKQKREELDSLFHDSCDTDTGEKKRPTMGFHRRAGIFGYSYIGKEFKKVDASECGYQSEKIGQSQVAVGLGLESILVVEIENSDQGRSDDGGHVAPSSRGITRILSQIRGIEKWCWIIFDVD